MTDAATNAGAPSEPMISALAQYIKDISFENPNAPRSLAPQEKAPEISIQVNVGGNQIGEEDYISELMLEGKATNGDEVIFAFELVYGGVFRIQNAPEEHIHPMVMIELPRLLFPFARQIIADAVRNGGFPPLFIDPIDFAALYRQKLAELQAEQAQSTVS